MPMSPRIPSRIEAALKGVGLAVLVLLVVAIFGAGFLSELIGAYWPELGRKLAALLGAPR